MNVTACTKQLDVQVWLIWSAAPIDPVRAGRVNRRRPDCRRSVGSGVRPAEQSATGGAVSMLPTARGQIFSVAAFVLL